MHLEKLFIEELSDVLNAERQIISALPKLIKAAECEELKESLQDHLKQTHGHVKRLRAVFKTIGKPVKGHTCVAMEGILEEGKHVLDKIKQFTEAKKLRSSQAQQSVPV